MCSERRRHIPDSSDPASPAEADRSARSRGGRYQGRIKIHGAGAVGAVVAVRTVCEQTIHPTANYENPDPACELDVVALEPRRADVDGVLVNAFGFGGQNATLAIRRSRADRQERYRA